MPLQLQPGSPPMRCTGDFVRDPCLNVPIAIDNEASKESLRRVVVYTVRVLGAAATTTTVSCRCVVQAGSCAAHLETFRPSFIVLRARNHRDVPCFLQRQVLP